MPTSDPIHDAPPEHADLDPTIAASFRSLRRRLLAVAAVIFLVILAIFLPPYLNVSRFQRRIASNLSASLGRPVHLDRVTLSLFPLPGFTLDNFVVDEDPAFGAEPILRADQVRATVRISSLWSRRVEFSKIALTDPHVNLVRIPDGRWNLESILLQASRIEAAPTTQRTAGPAPRFPYIQATGARLNLKLGQEKTPWSLNEADFALWLPQPRQWHFRLEARPQRTDSAPADAGILKLEATLGGAVATTLTAVPIDLHGNLQDAQLGGLSRLLLGRDAGVRGDLNLDLSILGTLGQASIATNLQLAHGRRADFVPPHLLSLEASCQASASETFHVLSAIECHWPPAGSSSASLLIASGAIPDTRQPRIGSASLTLPALPTATLLDWVRAATPHPPTGVSGTGTLSGSLSWNDLEATPKPTASATTRSPGRKSLALSSLPNIWSGELDLANESLTLPSLPLIPLGEVLLQFAPGNSLTLQPVALDLGGKQPATFEGRFDSTGYTLHLTGQAIPARLGALADAFPHFGQGLRAFLFPDVANRLLDSESAATPIHLDLTATRPWHGLQTWTQLAAPPPPRTHRHK